MIPMGEWTRAAWAQTWQVTLLVVAVALVTRLVARSRPHLAYALWLVVLVKCLTPPLWSSPSGVFSWMQRVVSGEPAGEVAVAPRQESAEPAVADAGLGPSAAGQVGLGTGPWQPQVVVVARPTRAASARAARGFSVEPEARTGWSWDLTCAVLTAVWMGGVLIVAGVAALRWARYRRLVRRSACKPDRAYGRLVARLSQRLGLRRRVRLLVTNSRTGPAVVGLVRPTVLLPETVVRGKSASDLEPILAHELIHVRRGDLWVGMLQMAVRAVWWFHPLVWWAVRLITREAERCCDEEVVAGLGCRPMQYARSLLDVLERKQSLQPVPAFPGVRPVEVTSRRLERIMRLGQGSHRRAPWWCWAVMLTAALAALPGAALVVVGDEASGERSGAPKALAAESRSDAAGGTAGTAGLSGSAESTVRHAIRPTHVTLPRRRARLSRAVVQTAQPVAPTLDQVGGTPDDLLARLRSGVEEEKRSVRVYRVDDALAAIRSEYGCDEEGAKSLLMLYLAGPRPVPDAADRTAAFEWSEEDLVVRETGRGHERIAQALEIARRHGLSQIVIEATFLRGPREAVEAIAGKWTLVPMDMPAADWSLDNPQAVLEGFDRPLPGDGAATHTRAVSVVEKRLPVGYQIIDDRRAKEIRDQFQADRQIDVLQAPKVVLFNGQTGCIVDCSQSPFVVGVVTVKGPEGEAYQPQIRVVPEGLTVRLRPLLREGRSLWLDYEVRQSKIRDVQTTTFARGGSEGTTPEGTTLQAPEAETSQKTAAHGGRREREGTTLQVPEVETTRLDASVEFPLGKTLLVSGLKTKDDKGNMESLLILIRASKVGPDRALADDKDLYTRVYDVADLVFPVPHKIMVEMVDAYRGYVGADPDHAHLGAAHAVGLAPAEPDFEALVELITATVAPDTWDLIGGWGTIRPLPKNLSLAVLQKREVHEEIADLLRQLRRSQDVRVMLETVVFDVPRNELGGSPLDLNFDQIPAVLDSRRSESLVKAVNDWKPANVLEAPPISLFNGQQTELSIALGAENGSRRRDKLLLQPVIADDRRSVKLSLVNVNEGASADHTSVTVLHGQALLVEITDRVRSKEPSTAVPWVGKIPYLGRYFTDSSTGDSAKRVFVLVRPTIVVKEEEERLGLL